jgi:ribonuclease P protein subunit RPR2
MRKGRGRRGRRTKEMVEIAKKRIGLLFSHAEKEGLKGDLELADRYVSLAFIIAKRYNVRLSPEQKASFCRKCSTFLLESKTSRTRIHSGRIVKKCLSCGSIMRIPVGNKKRNGEKNEAEG